MPAVASGADALANSLLTNLTAGIDFTLPTINIDDALFEQPGTTGPLYDPVERLTVDHLTTGQVDGTGVFDKLMTSLVAHLKVEYQANRISGAEYTKAYVGIVAQALQTAQQFLLAKDQAYLSALLVQAQARAAEVELITARVNLASAKVMLARGQYEAETAKVNYGLTKIKIATEDITYDNLVAQGAGIDIQNENLTKQGVGLDFTNTYILPKQETLLAEQTEVQRAQTSDTRSDGATVAGAIGKQKDLHSQQIDSYKRDSETKVAKIFSDAWITQKTIDEGLLAPTQFNNANIDAVLTKIRSTNGMT